MVVRFTHRRCPLKHTGSQSADHYKREKFHVIGSEQLTRRIVFNSVVICFNLVCHPLYFELFRVLNDSRFAKEMEVFNDSGSKIIKNSKRHYDGEWEPFSSFHRHRSGLAEGKIYRGLSLQNGYGKMKVSCGSLGSRIVIL